MANKLKKIGAKEKKEKNPSGFKFGRNLGSLLIVMGGLFLLFLIVFIPYSYISTYNNNKVSMFKGETAPTDLVMTNVKRIDADKFDLLDIDFSATEFNQKGDTVKFSLKIKWNENTTKLTDKFKPFANNSKYNVIAYVGLGANWVDYEAYSAKTSITLTNENINNNPVSKTITLSNKDIEKFPMKANTWPVKVTVDAPNAYLYLYFNYDKNGKTHTNVYILEYTYDEYHTSDTVGGLLA